MESSDLYVHIPAHRLRENLDFLLREGLQPEIACQDVRLEQLDYTDLESCAEELRRDGLKTTLHAPFQDFLPGTSSPAQRQRAQRIAHGALELAERINATRIVFHPGIPDEPDKRSAWLNNSIAFWGPLVPLAEQLKTVICLENIYDGSPESLLSLLRALPSEHFAHVFDIGHWHAFACCPLADWLEQLGSFLKHVHLHDNFGQSDEHLPIGCGTAPYATLFQQLQRLDLVPTYTIENSSRSALQQSLSSLSPFFA